MVSLKTIHTYHRDKESGFAVSFVALKVVLWFFDNDLPYEILIPNLSLSQSVLWDSQYSITNHSLLTAQLIHQ